MKPSNYTELEKAIEEMEAQKIYQKADLKNQLQLTKQSLKPANLVKNALDETVSSISQSGGLGNLALKAGGALAAGLLAKKFLAPRLAAAAFGPAIGKMAKAGASTIVVNNSDRIFAYGKAILRHMFTGKKKKTNQLHNGVHV